MRIARLASILLVVAVASACTDMTTEPRPEEVGIMGRVTSREGWGVNGVRIEILDGPDAGRFAVSHDWDPQGDLPARYEIPALRPGVVTVQASHPDYFGERKPVTILEHQTTQVSFSLVPR